MVSQLWLPAEQGLNTHPEWHTTPRPVSDEIEQFSTNKSPPAHRTHELPRQMSSPGEECWSVIPLQSMGRFKPKAWLAAG
jgi:hypothetical protein